MDGIRDDPNADGITAVHLAARCGNDSLVRKVINLPRGEPDHEKALFSPLHEAAAAGHLEIVRILLEGGAFINSTDPSGRTALFFGSV